MRPACDVRRRRRRSLSQELGNVEADAAGADDGDTFADGFAPEHDVDVAQHRWMVGAGQTQRTRGDAGGEHDRVETAQRFDRRDGI